jgi:hypothetical protein
MNDCNAMHRQALQNASRAPARTADPELDDEATRSIRPDSDARGKGSYARHELVSARFREACP